MIKKYIENLANKGFRPKNILDIGANQGNFTRFCKYLWPISKVYMFEANYDCVPYLIQINEPYFINLLGDEDDKNVTFYKTKINNTCTGNSIYRENTSAYSDENLIKEIRKTITLDTIFKDDNIIFDFAKLDTQGSELDIIKGGLKILSNCKYILIEVSLKYYNEGIPLKDEIINFMREIGYNKYEVVEQHIWESSENISDIKKGEIFQEDLIFYK